MDDATKPKKKKKKKAKPAAPLGVEVAARYWNEVTSISADASGHQLGSGGLFVATDEAPELGTLFDFELSVGGDPPITGIVEVVELVEPRSTADGSDAHAQGERAGDARGSGMRVKFVHLEDEEHARDVLGKMTIAQTASVAPPPSSDAGVDDDAPRSSKGGAVWDRAVALEDDFFDRASREPSFVPDDAVADAMEVRLADPSFIERQQRLRRTFGAVIAVFAVLFGVTAVRSMSAPEVRTEPAAPARAETKANPAPAPTVSASPATASPAASAPTLAPTSAPTESPVPESSAAPDAKEAKDAKDDEKSDAKAAPSAPEAPSAIAPAAQRRPPASRTRGAATPKPPRPATPAAPAPPAPKGGGDIYE